MTPYLKTNRIENAIVTFQVRRLIILFVIGVCNTRMKIRLRSQSSMILFPKEGCNLTNDFQFLFLMLIRVGYFGENKKRASLILEIEI